MKTIDLMSISHYLSMLQKTELNKARTHIKELYLQNILEDKFLINPELDNNPFLKAYVQGNLIELLESLESPPGFEEASLFLRRPKPSSKRASRAHLQVIRESKEHLGQSNGRLLPQQTGGSPAALGTSKPSKLKANDVRLIQDTIISRRKKELGQLSPKTRVKFASHTSSKANLATGLPNSQESPKTIIEFPTIEERPDSPSIAAPTKAEGRKEQFKFVIVKGTESPRRSSLYAGKIPVLKHQDTFDLPTFAPKKPPQVLPSQTEAHLNLVDRDLGSVEGLKSEDFDAHSHKPDPNEPGKTGSNPSHLKSKSVSKNHLEIHSRYYMEKEVAKEEVEIELRQLQRRHSTRIPKLGFNLQHSKELGSVSLIPFSRHPSFDYSKMNDQVSIEENKEASAKPLGLRISDRRSYSIEDASQLQLPLESNIKRSLTNTRENTRGVTSIKDPSEVQSKNFGLASTGFASHNQKTQLRETFHFTTGSAGPAQRHKPEATISTFNRQSPKAVKTHRIARSIGDIAQKKYAVSDSNPYEDYLPEASSGTSTRKPYSDLMAMRGKVTGFLRSIEYNTSINSNPNHLRKVHKLLQI